MQFYKTEVNMSNTTGNNNPIVRRYHRVVRDSVKTIQPQLFKQQLVDTSDIIGKKKLAPRTKKAMMHHFFEHLENYFVQPGRKIPGRPLQKLVDRQFDAIKKDLKEQANKIAEEEDRRRIEPLNDDLRTSGTKGIQSSVTDISPTKMYIFPTRNPGDVRKSYVKRTPTKRIPPSLPFLPSKMENNSTNVHFTSEATTYELKSIGGVLTMSPQILTTPPPIITTPSYSTRSRSKSPNKVMPSSIIKQQVVISNNEHQQHQQTFPMEIELTHIPQYSNEISVDDSGEAISEVQHDDHDHHHHHTVNSNVLDLSDLIQTSSNSNDAHIDGKIEMASSDLVLCTSIDEMSEVIVMGQNGERYRFVALNDGQVSLVADSSE